MSSGIFSVFNLCDESSKARGAFGLAASFNLNPTTNLERPRRSSSRAISSQHLFHEGVGFFALGIGEVVFAIGMVHDEMILSTVQGVDG